MMLWLRVEATYQNIDSFEVGITDVDHYFEYLGGISKAVAMRAQARPLIYLSDSLSPQTKIRSWEETIRLERVFKADVVIHLGTHGAMEFMPRKQVGLSSECWPDRLIGELPNIYLYSVNNPSEGTIAKRRSYAELISYLTPPIENAGLCKGLTALKESITAYRQSTDQQEREHLFKSIEAASRELNFNAGSPQASL